MATARITGLVLNTVRRRGKSAGSGKDYDLTEAGIIVAGVDVVKVTYFTDNETAVRLVRGEMADLLVSVTTYRGEAQFNVTSPWPTDADDAAIDIAAALSNA